MVFDVSVPELSYLLMELKDSTSCGGDSTVGHFGLPLGDLKEGEFLFPLLNKHCHPRGHSDEDVYIRAKVMKTIFISQPFTVNLGEFARSLSLVVWLAITKYPVLTWIYPNPILVSRV